MLIVLILVLLELILLLTVAPNKTINIDPSFNPCFIGTYSFTKKKLLSIKHTKLSFNPCFIGTYSFTRLHLLQTY